MRATALLFAAALTSCNQAAERPDICSPVPSFEVRMNASLKAVDETQPPLVRREAARMVAEFCLSQNSRQLAGSTDDAATVARAVVEKCRAEIEAFAGVVNSPGDPLAVRSLAVIRERFTEEALALTVEARAGGCQPIP